MAGDFFSHFLGHLNLVLFFGLLMLDQDYVVNTIFRAHYYYTTAYCC